VHVLHVFPLHRQNKVGGSDIMPRRALDVL